MSATIGALLLAGSLALVGCFGPPPRPDGPQNSACLEHAVFGPPEKSPYVLPYPVGSAYEVFQTYCGPLSHGKDDQMAIDFRMPIGSEVVAARAGVVRNVTDYHEDYGNEYNVISIEHADGTSARYGHLEPNSARVHLDDRVVAGQVIALSGASGTGVAHLHFGVCSRWPIRRADDVPVNFRNAQGPLDERGGLLWGVTYQALPYADR